MVIFDENLVILWMIKKKRPIKQGDLWMDFMDLEHQMYIYIWRDWAGPGNRHAN